MSTQNTKTVTRQAQRVTEMPECPNDTLSTEPVMVVNGYEVKHMESFYAGIHKGREQARAEMAGEVVADLKALPVIDLVDWVEQEGHSLVGDKVVEFGDLQVLVKALQAKAKTRDE